MTTTKKIAAGAVVVTLALCAVGAGSYRLGYARGSGNITQPPLALLNTRSSGDPAQILTDQAATVDFGNFWKAWNLLDANFAPTSTSSSATTTTEARVAGAIQGLASSYNDPYTVFIPKEQANDFKQQVNGEFEGIGAALNQDDSGVIVIGLLPNSPATKTDLKPGDHILAVDGQPTAGQELGSIIPRIRGPKGSTVSLTVVHAKSQKEVTITVTRGTVIIPTTATRVVSAAKNVVAAVVAKAAAAAAAALPGSKEAAAAKAAAENAAKQQFFVLQLATFSKSSIDAFVTDLGHYAHSDTKNLIIDLRNNPGGYLDVAADLASYFLPSGALVVTEKEGASSRVTEYRSKGYPLLSGATSSRRIVVLLNRNSASASEILAGALQDHHVAKVVGETSFGKGSVQTIIDVGNLGTLKVTIARWFTPSGKNISHTGIAPDIAVDVKDPKFASSTDPYMDAAVETLLDDSLWK